MALVVNRCSVRVGQAQVLEADGLLGVAVELEESVGRRSAEFVGEAVFRRVDDRDIVSFDAHYAEFVTADRGPGRGIDNADCPVNDSDSALVRRVVCNRFVRDRNPVTAACGERQEQDDFP